MKISFTFLFLMISSISFSQDNQLLITSHIKKLQNAKKYTLSIASTLGNEQYEFKPMKSEMSFKEQLVHLGENIYWLSSTYISEILNPLSTNKPDAKKMDKQAVLIFIDEAYEYAISALSKLDTNTLSKEFKWSNGNLNKFQFLNLIQDHQSHHVGQLIVYIRLNDVEPPKYIGW